MYAEIIIPLALPKNYTWFIPENLRAGLQPGCRVEVTLRNKKYAGIVKRFLQEKPDAFDPKPIGSVLDAEPLIYPEQLRLWEWIAAYYMCSEGEVMAASLPAHFKLSSESILVYQETYGDDFSSLDNEEYLIAEALLIKKELRLSAAQELLGSSAVYPVVKRLIEKSVCFVWEALTESYKPRKETYILLHSDYAQEEKLEQLLNEDKKLQRAEKQVELLLSYLHLQKTEPEVTRTALLKKSGASDAQLKGLMAKNILVAEQRSVDRLRPLPKNIRIDFSLSWEQERVFSSINENFETKGVNLLHGITSSGKTQVYIRMIEKFLLENKQVLYLVPEIALTSQIVRKLQQHFGGYLGIYHSRFSQNERFEIWKKVRRGEIRILMGARSSLFLPFTSLGLIIVDEEHDTSYKQQDPAPRYHARDTAIFYASLFKAKVLLGSATPSVESYFNALSGKYGLTELAERYGQVDLPVISLIDTKRFLQQDGSKLIFSPDLLEAIQRSLDNHNQVILFRNRRGYSPYQICKVCGWIPQCKQCDVSLTYHKLTNKLQCHYCGSSYPPVNTCAACGNQQFIQRNFGTEKIEEELENLFPKARIARMDVDSVRGKSAHDQLIRSFEQQKLDILVGTQMVVKGLDFDRVDLVGILDADSLLNFSEFRVNERAFQLMEQVSGRAGRKDGKGKVLIQVANTKHPVLQYVIAHDYKSFYDQEIIARKNFFYPPFSRIIQISFRHKIKEIVHDAAAVFALHLKKDFESGITGPAEPVVGRIRNQYIMELMLKLPKNGSTIAYAKQVIQQQRAILQNDSKFRSVTVVPDIDPV
ncbi:MAG: primosomal protein N' [Bacteroidota bacterium]|nr:primosomal protein N' [Bacteroidota bacterium]